MAGDIKLDGDWVIVEGRWTRLRTWDLMLDSPHRRRGPGRWRRALVHDPTDGLTINWAGDYPGGVSINGPVRFHGQLQLGDQPLAELVDKGQPAQRVALGHDGGPNALQIRGRGLQVDGGLDVGSNATFGGALRAPDFEIGTPGGSGFQQAPRSVAQELSALRQEIQELRARVQVLEEATP